MTRCPSIPAWVGCLVGLGLAAAGWASLLRPGFVEIGPDEGMEMAKALLLALEPEKAGLAWTDQPWLYAKVLAWIWRGFGPPWDACRLFTVVIAVAWLLALPRLMPAGATAIHGLFGALFLLTWPSFLPLSCSMMVEVPCLGLATLALVPLMNPKGTSSWGLALSGIIAGVATGLKLVALLAGPAWALALWRAAAGRTESEARGTQTDPATVAVLMKVGVWAGAFLVTSVGLLAVGPHGPRQSLLAAHVQSFRLLWSTAASGYTFAPSLLIQVVSVLCAAAVGWRTLVRQGRRQEAAVPLVLFLTPLAVHLVHRPFWDHYLVHFATGAVVLGGWGMGELTRGLWQQLRGRSGGVESGRFEWQLVVAAWVVACWVGFDVDRAWTQRRRILEAHPRLEQSQVVEALRNAAGRVHYAYSREPAFVAQAGCLAVPELTIMPRKRFWSGDLTETTLLETVKRHRPEALVLRVDREGADPGWREFLKAHYTHVVTDRGLAVYLLNRSLPVRQYPGARERLSELGL